VVSINAIVDAVSVSSDRSGNLYLKGAERGQPLLSFKTSPSDVVLLVGRQVWGGAGYLMYGETKIADRVGYTGIEFCVSSIQKAILEHGLRKLAKREVDDCLRKFEEAVVGATPRLVIKGDIESLGIVHTHSLKDFMKRATALSRQMWPDNPEKADKVFADRLLSRLLEESGELAGAIHEYFGKSMRPELKSGNLDAVREELGDALVVLLRIAGSLGVDPSQAVTEALDKFENRMKAVAEKQVG